jgi:hypothetical protein
MGEVRPIGGAKIRFDLPEHQRERLRRLGDRLTRDGRIGAACKCGKDNCDRCATQNLWDVLMRLGASAGADLL